MNNEYTPWLELGLTELEYFKHRYLEARAETHALLTAADAYIAVLTHSGLMPDAMLIDKGETRRAWEAARDEAA